MAFLSAHWTLKDKRSSTGKATWAVSSIHEIYKGQEWACSTALFLQSLKGTFPCQHRSGSEQRHPPYIHACTWTHAYAQIHTQTYTHLSTFTHSPQYIPSTCIQHKLTQLYSTTVYFHTSYERQTTYANHVSSELIWFLYERQRERSHLVVHTLSAYNDWSCARLNPGAGSSSEVSQVARA